MTEDKITMYVVPNCPICETVRKWLDDNGIAYDEQDVANNYGALRKMYKLTRQELVPVIVVDGKAFVRPDDRELAELFTS